MACGPDWLHSPKMTNLLYIDDMKMYGASEGKLARLMIDFKGSIYKQCQFKVNEK